MSEAALVSSVTPKPNDNSHTVVRFGSPEQALEALRANYVANSQLWFDNNPHTQWPYKGIFHQRMENLPAGEELRRFILGVEQAFSKYFPVDDIEVIRTCTDHTGSCVLIWADPSVSPRTPRDYGTGTTTPPTR